ncbi:hypothetical protein Tco_1225057 [Tanacetum coccineum]
MHLPNPIKIPRKTSYFGRLVIWDHSSHGLQKDWEEETQQMEECHRILMDQVDLVNPEGHRLVLDVSKPLPLGGPPGQSEREYDISAAYGISHWWFKRKEFYITRHSAPLIAAKADYKEYVGIKRLFDYLGVTAAKVCVTVAK